MLAHGIDIVQISRIEKILKSQGDRFLRRIYTAKEIECCKGKIQSLAARFAAKEAVVKTFKSGNTGIYWQDIEVTSDENGAPLLKLYGKAETKAKELGIKNLAISLSHDGEYAIASVIGEKNEDR